MFWERNLNDDEDDPQQKTFFQNSSSFQQIDCVNDPEDQEFLLCNVKKQLYNPESKKYEITEEEQRIPKKNQISNFWDFESKLHNFFNPINLDEFIKPFEENFNDPFEQNFNTFSRYNYQTQNCRNDPHDQQYLICDINKKFFNPETNKTETITEQKRIKISNENVENQMIKSEPQKNQDKIYEI